MMKRIVDVIAGARPNFMKVSALFSVADAYPSLELRLIHTGQHYDSTMSDVFLKQLGLPEPSCHLGVGSLSHGAQTAEIIKGYERWIQLNKPNASVVVGDVNSTVACALVAAKEGITVAHVEAGLRSGDRSMPEEINRVLTDSISDMMFASEASAVANLSREGRPLKDIYLVGNVMIDTLLRMKPQADRINAFHRFGVSKSGYALLTLHRPVNVDNPVQLGQIMEEILLLAERVDVVFPIHPRTNGQLKKTGWLSRLQTVPRVHISEPVGYLESLSLLMNAAVVITDSGGLQEETSFLGVPCLTLRDNTERPITIFEGTNKLISGDWSRFSQSIEGILATTKCRSTPSIPYWDGLAGHRILRILAEGK